MLVYGSSVYGSPLQRRRVDWLGTKNIGWGLHMPRRGSADSTLADTYALLSRLRRAGVQAHAWI